MTINQLGKILREMYDNAPNREKVTHIHLFGIKYAEIIITNKYSINEIIKAAGLHYCPPLLFINLE